METNPELDDDVAAIVKSTAERRGVPVRRALNDLVRAGEKTSVPAQATGEIRRTRTFHMGSSPISGTDCTAEMLDIAEGPLWR